jgi:hypothetical protein
MLGEYEIAFQQLPAKSWRFSFWNAPLASTSASQSNTQPRNELILNILRTPVFRTFHNSLNQNGLRTL